MLNVGRKKYIHIYIYKYIYVYMYMHIYILIYIFEVCSVFYRRFYIFKYSKTEILKSTERADRRRNLSRDDARASFSFSKMTSLLGKKHLSVAAKFFSTSRSWTTRSSFVLRREETYRFLSGGRIDFPKGRWILHWSHFVISTNLCEYQTRPRTSLVPAALQ